jgi:hypothetical protein
VLETDTSILKKAVLLLRHEERRRRIGVSARGKNEATND